MTDFFKPLCAIQKLGEALRATHPSWKILYIQEVWQNDVWIREICHHADEGALIYAQTRIPKKTYLAHEAIFSTLGTHSIGDHFLFQRPDVLRSPFQCTIISPENEAYADIAHHLGSEPLFYKRESLFQIGENTLSISECFGQKALKALGIKPT
ncbi:MAG: chorismate lyase [Gammaproteobacteria bacterium]|nr:chorismate lyase [Gammaproteobacteria bacterium]